MSRGEPTLESITSFLNGYIKTADLETVTIKNIRQMLSTELGAEQGTHYEKSWLKESVDQICLDRMNEDAPKKEADKEDADMEDAAPAKEGEGEDGDEAEEPAAPKRAKVPMPPPPAGPLGTVLWAKQVGYVYWPAIVAREERGPDRHMRDGGWTFVRYFGTNQFAYCNRTMSWAEGKEKCLKEAEVAHKKKPASVRGFKLGVEEAEAEIANPSPVEPDLEIEEDEEGDEEGEEEGEEDEEGEEAAEPMGAGDSSDEEAGASTDKPTKGLHKRPVGAAPKGANGLKMTWSATSGKWLETTPVAPDSSDDEAAAGGGAGSSGGAKRPQRSKAALSKGPKSGATGKAASKKAKHGVTMKLAGAKSISAFISAAADVDSSDEEAAQTSERTAALDAARTVYKDAASSDEARAGACVQLALSKAFELYSRWRRQQVKGVKRKVKGATGKAASKKAKHGITMKLAGEGTHRMTKREGEGEAEEASGEEEEEEEDAPSSGDEFAAEDEDEEDEEGAEGEKGEGSSLIKKSRSGKRRPKGEGGADEAPKPKTARSKAAENKAAREATGEPKRPANAYMHFMASRRAAVKAEHPTADMGAVSKIVSELWKAMDEDARKPYEQVRSKECP